MSTMTQASHAVLRHRRLRLTAGTPVAAAAAAAIRAVIGEWQVPVDGDLAAMLASDLVINAAVTGAAGDLMLVARCAGHRFRAEIHDASVCGDSWESAVPGSEAQRGLAAGRPAARPPVAATGPPRAGPCSTSSSSRRPMPQPAAGRPAGDAGTANRLSPRPFPPSPPAAARLPVPATHRDGHNDGPPAVIRETVR